MAKICSVLILLMCLPLCTSGEIPPAYIEKLKAAETPQEFKNVISSMVEGMWADKLSIESKDIQVILSITHTKPFANEILQIVYGWLGIMYGSGQTDEGIIYFFEKAMLLEKTQSLEYAIVCLEIALFQHKAKNYVEAEVYYKKSMEVGRDSLKHTTIINCINGLALINRERGQYDKAKEYFDQALQVAVKHNDIAWIGILKGNIGSLFYRKEEYDSSLVYYHKNLTYIRKTPESENHIETFTNLGKVYLKLGDYRSTKTYLDSAMYIIKSRHIRFTDFFNPMDEIYETYALLYAATKNYELAFEYYRKFFQSTEEKQLQIDSKRLAQIQSSHEFRQKQLNYEFLEKVNVANQAIIRQQNYAQIAFITVILVLAGSVVFAVRTSRLRKKLNTELNTANVELERLNQTKDKLFSVISHDLRSPINNLSAMLAMAKTGDITREEFTLLINKLQQQVSTTGDIINSLLQWSKTEMSGTKLQRERIPVTFIQHVTQHFTEDLQKKKITLTTSLQHNTFITVNKDQFEIIMRNLLSNAIKFTREQGQVHVSSTLHDAIVEIKVSDNGVGISEADMLSLFKPGRHLSKPGTQNESGTGIGLFITQEMVLANGGTINVESEPDKGATFTIKFPA